MLRYHMQGFSGYGVQYSPFFDNKLAVAAGSNFGLVGNGKLYILEINRDGKVEERNSFLTQDCLFDVAWNESHENQVLVAQGDGTLRLFDTTLKEYPIAIFKEHEREVFSCNWNLVNRQTFLSSSWDGSIKIWSPLRNQSLMSLTPRPLEITKMVDPLNAILSNKKNFTGISQNKNCVYQAQFSPHDQNLVISCSGNSYASLFDIRLPPSKSQTNFLVHSGLEALTCDFNKYRPYVIATGGVDNAIRIWDIRMLKTSGSATTSRPTHTPSHNSACINEIPNAHGLAIRKVTWSPHHSNILMSASYDMTCRVWKDLSNDGAKETYKTNSTDTGKGCLFNFTQHSEFVFGIDWSLWGKPGYVASTAWDGNLFVWNGLGY
ncbi:hypothetical protein SUVZ_02G2680 [Saccharomyces uvarum]|uniref:Peroxin-7 n=1 Tax=Saccharomyces uvarum TaxID=230603 RepID=A0ABN8WQ19_SACUV|nr:hypothetical protein SUVZ_02G2680 [Saccharomyces uvarum]